MRAAHDGTTEGTGHDPRQPARFVVEPFTEACREILERRQHVVVGISPGNSYFRVTLLTELLGWLTTEFDRVDVVIPDSALEHTYLALGYDARRAASKTRAEINVLRNRVSRAWQRAGGPRDGDGLHRMSALASLPVYREKIAEAERALAEDELLWRTCAEMSREVLVGRGHTGEPDEASIRQAIRYLVAELPFFLASADIFGVPSSLNFYHQRLPLAELIFGEKTVLRAPRWQAYATIRPGRPIPRHRGVP